LTPRLEKMPWFNNQSTITVDSPRQQKPMFRGEHNGPGHFIEFRPQFNSSVNLHAYCKDPETDKMVHVVTCISPLNTFMNSVNPWSPSVLDFGGRPGLHPVYAGGLNPYLAQTN
jgi:hypothetical protein